MDIKTITIIGSGLSGLYAAYLLKAKYKITIIEARDRVGGRILTENGHDLGPSWVWSHHKLTLGLINTFNLTLVNQYTKGYAKYQTPDSIEEFTPPPSAPQARVQGGLSNLVDALLRELNGVTIILNEEVISLSKDTDTLHVKSTNNTYSSDIVINTLSPRLAAKLAYTPTLDDNALHILNSTPTWMGHSRKCVIEYENAFWKDKNLSGFCFSPKGVLAEIHDASTSSKAALFGFVNSHINEKDIKERVIAQLIELFGDEAKVYSDFLDVSWRDDKYCATFEDRSIKQHPKYGYNLSLYEDRLHFISTESSFVDGGYLEGAVNSAKELSKHLWYCHAT